MIQRHARQQLSLRGPVDEYEAWLAGLIVTDGTIERRTGYTILTQRADARPAFELLGARFERTFRFSRYTTNFGECEQVKMTFLNLPIRWKRAVPVAVGSSLERHYWRGVIDGDGCITTGNRGTTREVQLAWNPHRETFLGDAFCALLGRLGVRYRLSDSQAKWSIRKARVRCHADAQALALWLYEDARIALPRKQKLALTQWQVQPRPEERTHCPHGHPYDTENTYRTREGHRQCRACGRAVAARKRLALAA